MVYSLVDLQAAINRFIKEYNTNDARPFIWKADPDEIIAARLPRSHRILARRVAVKGLRDLADDLAHISQVAGSLCVYQA